MAGAGAGAMGAGHGTMGRASGDAEEEPSSNPVSSSQARSTTSLVGREVCPAPAPLGGRPPCALLSRTSATARQGPKEWGRRCAKAAGRHRQTAVEAAPGAHQVPVATFRGGHRCGARPTSEAHLRASSTGRQVRAAHLIAAPLSAPHAPLASGLIPARRVALVQIEA